MTVLDEGGSVTGARYGLPRLDERARHEHLRTSCGRELTVGRLALGDAQHPAARVFVDLGDCSGCDGTGWAAFTVAEARQLARAVLSQAAAAERDCQAPAPGLA